MAVENGKLNKWRGKTLSDINCDGMSLTFLFTHVTLACPLKLAGQMEEIKIMHCLTERFFNEDKDVALDSKKNVILI
jgi:hypothetical protein